MRAGSGNESYMVFTGNGEAIFSTLIDGKIAQRGEASYSNKSMQHYINLLETSGIYRSWHPTLLKKLNKEYVVYKANDKLCACYGARLVWRSESEFMQSFWQIIDMENFEWICGDADSEPENFRAC